ncbi:hypothetical protein [Halobacteriaceae bacterium SHR40]|uniref:hypothetical protein n=1 Tax=Halovenus amylolytica TaxID=2500550 RepID=UPI000FE3C034
MQSNLFEAMENSKVEVQRDAGNRVVSAFRDDDAHLIVIRERETDDVQLKRVPATRTAVVKHEKLWTIPSNWEERIRIRDEPADYLVCHIPESGVDVVVQMPGQNQATDSQFRVEKFGTLEIEIADEPKYNRLHKAIVSLEAQDETPEEVVAALRTLAENWRTFTWKYTSHMRKWGHKAVWRYFTRDDVATVDSWVIDPWEGDRDITHLIWESTGIGGEIRGQLVSRLLEAGVVSPCPEMHLKFEERRDSPVGYEMEALIEAGCAPTAAIDYVMVVLRGGSASAWARSRDVSEERVHEHISAVEETLDA